MTQRNKKKKPKPQAERKKTTINKPKEGHLLLFYKLNFKPAVCPRLSGKLDLHGTNDTYQNSIFTLFSLSPLHILSSFSHVLCFPFPIFVFLLPPPHFCLKAFSIFQLSSPSPCSQSFLSGKDLRPWITFAEVCSLLWRELDLHFCAIRWPEASS